MRTIRASEIGAFLYCQRAWWYQKQGVPSENITARIDGIMFHHQHAQASFATRYLRILAYVMIVISLAAGAYYLTG